MIYIDGNKFRENSSGGSTLGVLDGNKIRERSSGGSVIATMSDVRKSFKNPIGGISLVAAWLAFAR